MTKPVIEELASAADLKGLSDDGRPVFILKHSTTCPVSAAAYRAFRQFAEANPDAAVYRLVRVIEQRPLSNELASRFGVKHESPQVLVLRGGRVQWHASHGAITEEALAKALATVGSGAEQRADRR